MANVTEDEGATTDFRPMSSHDTKDDKLALSEKAALIEAMQAVGAQFVITDTSPRLFGYYNPMRSEQVDPMAFNGVNLDHIVDEVSKDFPKLTLSLVKWNLFLLFKDMAEVCQTVESSNFNPLNDSKFPQTSTRAGKPTYHYNTFDPEYRPITNTVTGTSKQDELLGNVLYKAVTASAHSIAGHSVVGTDSKETLFDQVMSTFGGYVQPLHKRLFYSAVILGKQGSGKSILANLLAHAGGYAEYMAINKLTGDFGSRWNNACTIVVDEATIETELQSNMLKNFITATTADLEEKYQNAVSATLYMNFLFTTNRIEDFRTFETENRRYYVLTADGSPLGDGHECITPRITVTAQEYYALKQAREYGHLPEYDGDRMGFIPSKASDVENRDGTHTIVLSQLGDISSKPKEYLSAFKVFSGLLAKQHKPELKLEQLSNRQRTTGQMQLSTNVPSQLRVKSEHDIITDLLHDFETGKTTDEMVVNNQYVNLNAVFNSKNSSKTMLPHVHDYFTSKFKYKDEAYCIVNNRTESLLIKCEARRLDTMHGEELKAKAKAKHEELFTHAELISENESITAEERKVNDTFHTVKLKAVEMFPNGSGSVDITEMCNLTGVAARTLKANVSRYTWLSYNRNEKTLSFNIE